VNRAACIIGIAASLALGAYPARAQLVADAYEQPPLTALDRLLPAVVLQSGNHRIENDYDVRGNLVEFGLESSFGSYRPRSIPMVVVRVQEILTLAQAIDAYQRSNRELATELRGVMRVGADNVGDIITSPIRTSSSIVSQFFTNNIGQTVKELSNIADPDVRGVYDAEAAAKKNVYEAFMPSDPILAAHKRSVANQLGLDVFSSNPMVQAFLDTLAKARGGGRRNAGLITVSLPRGVEIAVADRGIEAKVASDITRKTIRELYEQNFAELQGAGAPEDLVHAFLTHPTLSPRHKTSISAYLARLEGVSNRRALLDAALGSVSEEDALAYVQVARILLHYHRELARLARLSSGGGILVAVTDADRMLVTLPFDLLYWNRETDEVFSKLTEFAARKGYAERELLLTGVASEKAKRQLAERGFVTRESYLFR